MQKIELFERREENVIKMRLKENFYELLMDGKNMARSLCFISIFTFFEDLMWKIKFTAIFE